MRQLAREIDAAIAGFVRGQTAVCLILGSFYAVALTLSGLNFGLLIGLISGLITFIPYVGSMTGLILALGVAVAQFWPDWSSILMVLGIFLVGQFLEGNVLAPKLVGESVGLHPVWLMFALLAFGYLFGFVGLLVAVPLAATIGVLVRFALRALPRKLALYRRAAGMSAHGGFSSVRVSSCSRSIMPRASRARISSPARRTPRRWRWSSAGRTGRTGSWRWSVRKARAKAISPRSGRQARARACCRRACSTHVDLPAAFATGALVLEDLASDGLDERALFHLLNLAREERAYRAASPRARRLPALPVAIPDLASRLRALPGVALAPPDDALLRALIVKLAADRQLAVDEALVELSRQPHRALVCGRARRGRAARRGGACASTGR